VIEVKFLKDKSEKGKKEAEVQTAEGTESEVVETKTNGGGDRDIETITHELYTLKFEFEQVGGKFRALEEQFKVWIDAAVNDMPEYHEFQAERARATKTQKELAEKIMPIEKELLERMGIVTDEN
jgi:predicted RNase H-like nuclease (RuvC/YqgF family)